MKYELPGVTFGTVTVCLPLSNRKPLARGLSTQVTFKHETTASLTINCGETGKKLTVVHVFKSGLVEVAKQDAGRVIFGLRRDG